MALSYEKETFGQHHSRGLPTRTSGAGVLRKTGTIMGSILKTTGWGS